MAIDQEFIDLIQADIDGETDDAGKKALKAFLAESSEGRRIYEEQKTLCRSLDDMVEVDPPPHLRHVLMNMAPVKSEPRAQSLLRRVFGGSPLGYVAMFAAGVALTLALVDSNEVNRGAFDDVTGLVGTIAETEFDAPEHSTIPIDKSEVTGTVTLRSAGELLIIDFDLSAKQPVEIQAGYSDKSIWFNGFAQLESSGTSVAAQTGSVTLSMDGKRRYAVFLNNPGQRPGTIELQFMANGELIHEAHMNYGETN